jgi:EmrB/QacA subfamily drug resistance transporter
MARANVAGTPGGKTVTTATGARISQGQLIIIMVGVMLGVLLSALDQTVVGPALFKIVKDLQGLEHYSWVTTAYLLTSTITVPIVGKLSDLYGRKWFFVSGMIIFLIGSALSGQATGADQFSLLGVSVSGLTVGMAQLILFRAVQGIGGGMLMANAFAIIGDLVAPAERGRWQGLFGAVWGLSSVIGPTVGGYITDNIGWRWVFYVNLPVGLVALAVVIFTFPRLVNTSHTSRSIDWLGAVTLVGALTPLLIALSLGGSKDFPWDSTKTIGLFAVGGVLLVAFVLAEWRAKQPLLPLDLFKNRIFTLSMVTVFLVGVGMFGAIINLPLFIQGVQGDSATSSGNTITPMMLSMVVVSAISGQLLSRTGRYRILGVVGMAAVSTGLFLLSRMTVDTPRLETVGFMVIMGLGLGVAMPLYTVIVQNAFPVQRLGVVTSATTFFRSVGGTVGVAVLGGIVSNRFSSEYTANLDPQLKNNPQFGAFLNNLSPQALVSPDTINAIKQQLLGGGIPGQVVNQILTQIQAPIKPALSASITEAFLIGAIIAAVAIFATALIPEIPLRRSSAGATMTMEGAGELLAEESPAALEPALALEIAEGAAVAAVAVAPIERS